LNPSLNLKGLVYLALFCCLHTLQLPMFDITTLKRDIDLISERLGKAQDYL